MDQYATITLRVDSISYNKALDEYIISLPSNAFSCDCNSNNTRDIFTIKISDTSRVLSTNNSQNSTHNIMNITHNKDEKHIQLEPELESEHSPSYSSSSDNEIALHQQTYQLSKHQQQKQMKSIKAEQCLSIIDKYFFLLWMFYILLAVLFFMYYENMSLINSVYFRISTSFNIGYGDYYPQTNAGILLNCLFMIIDLVKLAYIDWRIMLVIFQHQSKDGKELKSKQNERISNKVVFFCALACIILCIIGGTLVMNYHEKYSVLRSFEWNIVTLTTTGYGNVVPYTFTGKLLCIVYIFVGYLLQLYIAVITFDTLLRLNKHSFPLQMSRVLVSHRKLYYAKEDVDSLPLQKPNVKVGFEHSVSTKMDCDGDGQYGKQLEMTELLE